MESSFRNRVLDGVWLGSPFNRRSTSPTPGTGSVLARAAVSVRITGQESVLKLIEFAVLFLNFVEGLLVKLLPSSSVDLLGELPNLFADEPIERLHQRTGFGAPTPVLDVCRFERRKLDGTVDEVCARGRANDLRHRF
jgi:hypothetical protein